MPTKEIYKDHEIIAATWYLRDSAQWKSLATIIEVKTGSISAPRINRAFSTEYQARDGSVGICETWIDDGKPPLAE